MRSLLWQGCTWTHTQLTRLLPLTFQGPLCSHHKSRPTHYAHLRQNLNPWMFYDVVNAGGILPLHFPQGAALPARQPSKTRYRNEGAKGGIGTRASSKLFTAMAVRRSKQSNLVSTAAAGWTHRRTFRWIWLATFWGGNSMADIPNRRPLSHSQLQFKSVFFGALSTIQRQGRVIWLLIPQLVESS